jgi:hypothetical protein
MASSRDTCASRNSNPGTRHRPCSTPSWPRRSCRWPGWLPKLRNGGGRVDLIRTVGEHHPDSPDRLHFDHRLSVFDLPPNKTRSTDTGDPATSRDVLPEFGNPDGGLVSHSPVLPGGAASLSSVTPPSEGRANKPAPADTPTASTASTSDAAPVFASEPLDPSAGKRVKSAHSRSGSGHTMQPYTAIQPYTALPVISVTPETPYIPVNANKSSGAPWRKDANGNELRGLPVIRDFDLAPMRDLIAWNGQGAPPEGPAFNDPDLKKLTAEVNNGQQFGLIQVNVSYTNPNGGGRVRLWTDQAKTTEIPSGGFLPDYPTCDFYVEGINPSAAENDVTISVTYDNGTVGVGAAATLTVTPMINSFTVTRKNPPTASFYRNASHVILGISSGDQADGAPRGSDATAVRYDADLNVRGISGDPGFIQNVTGLIRGSPAVALANGTQYNISLGDATLPMEDADLEAALPFYRTIPTALYGPLQKVVYSYDTPTFTDDRFAGQIESMDITFQARLYLTWIFGDNTIYTLARDDWQAVFQSTNLDHDPIMSPSSIVSVDPVVLTHTDPAKLTGPIFNNVGSAPGFWVQV